LELEVELAEDALEEDDALLDDGAASLELLELAELVLAEMLELADPLGEALVLSDSCCDDATLDADDSLWLWLWLDAASELLASLLLADWETLRAWSSFFSSTTVNDPPEEAAVEAAAGTISAADKLVSDVVFWIGPA